MVKNRKKSTFIHLIKDLWLSFELLRREGIKSFTHRFYWYFKGYRLAEDIPTGLKKIGLRHFGKKEFLDFKANASPLISIIIPAYNQWDYTYDCLFSILKNTQVDNYEVILADDVSTDETVNNRNYAKNLVVVRNETNLGFLKNINHAVKAARGKYLYLLNNDTQVTSGWLESITGLMEQDDRIGLAGSKLIFASGQLQEAGGIIFQDASGKNYGRKKKPYLPQFNYVKEVDYCSGAGICVRKDLWDRLGGFDERFAPAYYEDTDLAFSIRALGYKVVYQPKSVVFHFEGISHGRDINTGIKSKQAENRAVFFEKWKEVLAKDHCSGPEELFIARDRSRHKKTILVVDHFIPQYDKDAGSRSTFQYLMLLKRMGLNVKFLPDNFSRDIKYADALEQTGIEILYGARYRESIFDWMLENDRYIQYVYLNRPQVSIKYIDFIRERLSAKIIYQPHDLHFLRNEREYELNGNKEALEAAGYWKKIEEKIIRSAHVNVTFSSVEKSIIETAFEVNNCEVVPLFFYETFSTPAFTFDSRKDLLFVGGFNHPPNSDAVVWFIEDILPGIRQSIPGVKFHIVGSNVPEQIKKFQDDHIILHGFVSDKMLEELYNSVRLVVLPLRFGAGVKGKLVEAMYHGVPVVATGIALEGIPGIENIISPKNTSEEFIDEIVRLYSDRKSLDGLSLASHQFIQENFSVNKAMKILQEILSN